MRHQLRQCLWRKLLSCITQHLRRIGMHLQHKTVTIQQQRLFSHFQYQVAPAGYMAWIDIQRDVGMLAFPADILVPHRMVTVNCGQRGGKATVYGLQITQSGCPETVERALPQFQVGSQRVFEHQMQTGASGGIGQRLHHEWIHRCTRPNPGMCNPMFQSYFQLPGIGDFHTNGQMQLLLNLLQHRQGSFPHPFKVGRLGTCLPHTATEQLHLRKTAYCTRRIPQLLY